jgi:hypothetical protein
MEKSMRAKLVSHRHRHVIPKLCCFFFSPARSWWLQILMHRSFLCGKRNSDCNLAVLILFMMVKILATVGVRHPSIIILAVFM